LQAVRFRSRLATIAVLAAAVSLVGCGSGDASRAAPATSTQESAAGGAETATAGVRLARVRGGLGDALFVTAAPGQANRLYVVQQSGRILILDHGRLLKAPFLDISRSISSGGEQGLLGLAFHPDYAANGRFYVDFTNPAGDTRVVEYRRAGANRANPASARTLLRIDQPFPNHNGGDLAFGPDGDLYIASGDGGSGGDPNGNGQSTKTLLGKLLRIDVDGRTKGLPYGIPSDNPFASGDGRPEIYSYGLRNPWRFSFDRVSGDIWIGDVGQGDVEEIDHRAEGGARGVNFGWNAFEGSRVFKAAAARGSRPVGPVAQYSHAVGCSVTGGYVYRGTRATGLIGRYVYADYCSGKVWSMRAGPRPGGVREETGQLGVRLSNVTSFGEGLGGDLYVLANGSLYRFAGR
jgi:glucose/arabinose dehydrogenase